MKDKIISQIARNMLPVLDNAQMSYLMETLEHCFWGIEIREQENTDLLKEKFMNAEFLEMFLDAKVVEGCSSKTIHSYEHTLRKMMNSLSVHVTHIRTEDLRQYLSEYQSIHNCGKSSIDNIRRVLSSFFTWLEDENYILKSPMRRIHKIRTTKRVKETYSDETLETLRDNCRTSRDLAMIDLMISSGIRVGELVGLNRTDVDFEHRECVVFGKGEKERPVYFDARTKLHLQEYLDQRTDDDPALFITLLRPYKRLEISGVEMCLRRLGDRLGISKVHPHKFRRTMATRAIDKGMPIEQVQQLLGHTTIDTTMEYALVNQQNVKVSHKKYIA